MPAVLLYTDYADCIARRRLAECGYEVTTVKQHPSGLRLVPLIRAVVVRTGAAELPKKLAAFTAERKFPLLWWCDEGEPAIDPAPLLTSLDGILYPSMNAAQLKWSIHLSECHYAVREELAKRLEERRTIDRAKRILCELKQIDEEEAYRLLRNQAMNERKKIADVAASIVHVYELVQDRREQRGKKRSRHKPEPPS